MNFIRQIFENKIGDIHHKFVRYGKGEYERLYFELIKGKNLRVKSSYDFSNDFIRIIAENSKEDAAVKGKIIANRDFEKELEEIGVAVEKFSKRGRLYTAEIDTTLNLEQLKQLYERFEKNFLLLNVTSGIFKLKVGKSLPKPGGKVKNDFCKATLPLELVDEFAWDVGDFKNLIIKHIIKIDEIVISEELKNDPARARMEGKRKGKMVRILNIDDKEEKKEVELEV